MHSLVFFPTSQDIEYSEFDDIPIKDKDEFSFFYNSDLSGSVKIIHRRIDGEKSVVIEVPGWMLLEFVGQHVNGNLISEIENQSGRETLVMFQRMLA